jgi:hypothetical protein
MLFEESFSANGATLSGAQTVPIFLPAPPPRDFTMLYRRYDEAHDQMSPYRWFPCLNPPPVAPWFSASLLPEVQLLAACPFSAQLELTSSRPAWATQWAHLKTKNNHH